MSFSLTDILTSGILLYSWWTEFKMASMISPSDLYTFCVIYPECEQKLGLASNQWNAGKVMGYTQLCKSVAPGGAGVA